MFGKSNILRLEDTNYADSNVPIVYIRWKLFRKVKFKSEVISVNVSLIHFNAIKQKTRWFKLQYNKFRI